MCILPRKTKKCSSGIRGHVSGNLYEIMKVGCSPRGPGFEPQLPHDSSPPSITPVLGIQSLLLHHLYPSARTQALHTRGAQTHMQAKHIY